jgi:phosphoribosylamine--glycine ligase
VKVLVIGSGGREHALCRALSLDPRVTELVCAPGNPGIARIARTTSVDAGDPRAVAALAVALDAGLVVVGPEAPLVAGVADAVRAAGIPCFGPSREAARIEGSKAFAKDVMAAASVPTARSYACETGDEYAAALDAFGPPYVVKDDALAAGKGVVVTHDRAAALEHARACGRVVIEEYLDGPEVSLFAISDGTTVVPLLPAQDFKRVGDDDSGPNTGGMGAYAPLPWVPADFVAEVRARVLQPTIDEMRHRGTPFVGLLYAGLALTSRGLRVVEFNCRFGDPETQVVLPLLVTPLGGLLHAAAAGTLATAPPPRWHDGAAVTVVVAAEGYPAAPRTGRTIDGVDDANALTGTHVIHAGTRLDGDGRLVSSGGRVLAVTATGGTLAEARDRAYAGVDHVRLDGAHHRTDIAVRALKGEITVPHAR